MKSVDKHKRTLAIQQPRFSPLTSLAQLWKLINGPESVKDRIRTLLAANQSPSENIDIHTVSSALQEKLDKEGMQGYHFGIIADGNRRWAKAHGLDKTMGHKKGSEVIEDIIFPTISNVRY